MNNTYRSITQHHLLICTYHHHSCPTQQPFYEVEIIYFPVIFITQQTIYDVGVIKRSASVLNNNFTKQVINSWIFDVFIIKKVISAVFLSITRRCVLHLVFFQAFSSICTIIARFTPIFQCIMQHHCTVLSVQNRFFSTMQHQYGLQTRHCQLYTFRL